MGNLQDILGKRAIDVTVEELATVIAEKLSNNNQQETKDKNIVRGISGIQQIFQCSRSKASQIRKSGVIDKAIVAEDGRVILIDVDKAMDLMKQSRGGRKYGRISH